MNSEHLLKCNMYTNLQGNEAVVGSLISDDDSAYSIVSGDFSPESSTKSSVFSVNIPSVESSGDYTCKWVLSDGSQFHPIQTVTVTVRCKKKLQYNATKAICLQLLASNIVPLIPCPTIPYTLNTVPLTTNLQYRATNTLSHNTVHP